MLDELCKKDKYWRRIALLICKDKFQADDIVQEMYLKLVNVQKEINDFYVIITMKNIFLGNIKKESVLTSIDLYDFQYKDNAFEYDDREKEIVDQLKWHEKELIELSYDKSLREIQKEYNINYQFINRILTKAKNNAKKKESHN